MVAVSYCKLRWFKERVRTHNPLVAGSSPACPTFSTHTSERVFEHYANVAKTSFYAIFTQSTTNNQRNSKQYLFLSTDFSEIFSYFPIFSWEQWEFWERDSFPFHFQQLTVHLTVPIPTKYDHGIDGNVEKFSLSAKADQIMQKTVKSFLNCVISA